LDDAATAIVNVGNRLEGRICVCVDDRAVPRGTEAATAHESAAQSSNCPLRFCCAADIASARSEENNMAAFLAETYERPSATE